MIEQKGDRRSSCPGVNEWVEEGGAGATGYGPPRSMPPRAGEDGGRFREFSKTDESVQVRVVELKECSLCVWRIPCKDSETADPTRERDDDDGVKSVQYGLGQASIGMLGGVLSKVRVVAAALCWSIVPPVLEICRFYHR